MNTSEVVVVGELNVDVILNHLSSEPVVGKEVVARDMVMTMGSSSAIFACNLSSLGTAVAMVGKIGRDLFGDFILSELRGRKVDTTGILVDECDRTGATIVLNQGEDRANITYPGAMASLSIEDVQLRQFPSARHLHFSSFFLQPNMQPGIPQLFKAAKERGMTTSFDVQWDPAEQWNINLKEILPWVDVFLPNEKELILMTRSSSLQQAVDTVRDICNILVVKRGASGSLSYSNGSVNEIPAFLNENVADAIGAGDSFNAGFISRFIQGASIVQCQQFGNLTGAISTTEAGGTAAFNDIKTRLKHAMEQYGIVTA